MITEIWKSFRQGLDELAGAEIWAWRLTENGAHWGLVKITQVNFDYLTGALSVWWSFVDEVNRMNSLGGDDESDWDTIAEVYKSSPRDLYDNRFDCLKALKVQIMEVLPSADAIQSMQVALKQAEGE